MKKLMSMTAMLALMLVAAASGPEHGHRRRCQVRSADLASRQSRENRPQKPPRLSTGEHRRWRREYVGS